MGELDRTAEGRRLEQNRARTHNWQRWGPYLPDRQWGTVREDYSADGEAWHSFTHDQARSRAYRWGEDGLLGICDRQGRVCFAWALWNEQDAILKERLFGLTGPEGNHGEDVKELYYFEEATPTSSYLRASYKYPQAAFPYEQLLEENRRRGLQDREFELLDSNTLDESRYFDVVVEYAKAGTDDILMRLTAFNRGPDAARLHVLPTLWHRNTWAWGREGEGYWPRAADDDEHPIHLDGDSLRSHHPGLGPHYLYLNGPEAPVFCENETNAPKLFGSKATTPHPKDSFHDMVVSGSTSHRLDGGSKAAYWIRWELAPGASRSVQLRFSRTRLSRPFSDFDEIFSVRKTESEAFHAQRGRGLDPEAMNVVRQAYAGLLWSKKFYHYDVNVWRQGDPTQPPPPKGRPRNQEWSQLYNRDVISMPDAWEYPWYAAWDLAFHMIPMAEVDPEYAKSQLILLLREWYQHPNGCLPAYEYNFSDVNPPVHAWAAWRVYKMTAARGQRDRTFLARVFQKLLLNFTWWVNRKDERGNNLFSGGFLGLDNIGVFDRSKLPFGAELEQADGTAWMAFYASTMMSMALELARGAPEYGDLASKFFEHFVAIVDAMNDFEGGGLWDRDDGFYYDRMIHGGRAEVLRSRSLVGLVPLFASEILEDAHLAQAPGFSKRLDWFLKNRPELAQHVHHRGESRLIAVADQARLQSILQYLFDEQEFLSPFGIRSLSKAHEHAPFALELEGKRHEVRYVSGESDSWMFGGNSNWRGPVWLPMNYLIVEALERYHHFYGEEFKVEVPRGSGNWLTLQQAAAELCRRLSELFLPQEDGHRPCHGEAELYRTDPHFAQRVLFYEYFDGDTGRGLGASHQTGWTALVTRTLKKSQRA